MNERAHRLVEALVKDATALRVGVSHGEAGECLVDAGADHQGGIAAGIRLAEIYLGGLGKVRLATNPILPHWPWTISVSTPNPVVACLVSQYASWRLAHGNGKGSFFALGSGPAQALARKEKLFEELGYDDKAKQGVLVLESAKPPPPSLVKEIAEVCGLATSDVTILYAPTQSLAGGVQVIARVLEVALHKAHELHFPLSHIVDDLGAAALPPPHSDLIVAMGRTNDAIIFGGRVLLFVTGPLSQSRDYGKSFIETFRAFKGDFCAIDPMLFSTAEVIVAAIDIGECFFCRSGRCGCFEHIVWRFVLNPRPRDWSRPLLSFHEPFRYPNRPCNRRGVRRRW